MALIQLRRTPSRRELNWFALCWLLFFAVAGIWIGWRFDWTPAAWIVLALAMVIPLAGLVHSPVLYWAYLGLSYVTFPIGYVVGHLVMAAAYYLVLTPVALVMRVVGYDPLQRRFDRQAESYWEPKEQQPPPERYFRQY